MTQVLDNHSVHAFPLSGSQLIEASAGTGKTYTIANLYLRHILSGRKVRELLVVTFSEAATEELRGRIRARLHQAASLLQRGGDCDSDAFLCQLQQQMAEQADSDALQRLQLALHAMDEAAIFTIHGFCKRMLTEFAFNSGHGFRFEVGGDDAELHRRLLRDWWRSVFYADTDRGLLAMMQAEMGDMAAFFERLQPLLGLSAPTLLPTGTSLEMLRADADGYQAELDAVIAEWRQRGDDLKQRLLDCSSLKASVNLFKKRDEYLAEVDHYLLELGRLPPAESFAMLRQSALLRAQKKVRDPALEDDFFERCDALWQRLLTLRAQILPWALDSAAQAVLAGSVTFKQRSRDFSYDDLLRLLHQALYPQSAAGQEDEADALDDAEAAINQRLAGAIAQRYPVAMIDEFQDTDAVQYAIFRAVYRGREGSAWTMIGDPKQAIYSFRGGDIFTYARAKADVGADGMYTLDTNWRSVPAVIEATNRLFSCRDDAFIYSDAIPFEPAQAADKTHKPLLEDGVESPGMVLWHRVNEVEGKLKPLSKEAANEAITHALCAEIARLIEGGRRGTVMIGTEPLRPADIAVLVRKNAQADELRDALRAWGVAAVTVGNQKVFASAEATGLLTLLRAVAAPADRQLLSSALSSPLLGLDYAGMHAISSDDGRWGRWCAVLTGLHRQWQQHGFMAAFQALLEQLSIPAALAAQSHAERRITNLLHLGELCQQASRQHPGMDGMLHWISAQIDHPEGEQQELRLESDDELVQLVTIHKSKGLEYPVVFVPYAWDSRKPKPAEEGVAFHNGQTTLLDIGSEQQSAHLCLAERQRLAEDLRLLYVAVTRAGSRCTLIWGSLGSSSYSASAPGYLLMNAQRPDELQQALPDAAPKGSTAAEILARIEALDGGAIAVRPLPDAAQMPLRVLAADAAAPRFSHRRLGREVASDWRVESFSSLARELPSHSISRAVPEADAALRFARGSQVGSFLHRLLEELDFQAEVAPQLRARMDEVAQQFGLDISPAQRADLLLWLPRLTRTPLDEQGLRLADIGNAQRLNELEFDFSTARVDISALDGLLSEHAGRELPGIGAAAFRGIVNGIIDMVFEHQGRYYLADYKSNYLGPSFADYASSELAEAMLTHRYDLQAVLYTLALHRYLRTRIDGYDYQRHFGGAFYLFMRGMRPDGELGCGVYHDRLQPELLQRLDEQVFCFDLEAHDV